MSRERATNVLFCHAAGFCAEVWRPAVAELLTLARAAGAPEPNCHRIDLPGHGAAEAPELPLTSWQPFGAAVASAAAGFGGGRTIGVGHSIGGTSLVLAELAQPGTFDALVLYEPILSPPSAPRGRREGSPLAAGAARRRSSFSSPEAARTYFKSKPLFAGFDPRALDGYLSGGLRAAADGSLELCCIRELEADIYRSDISGIWERLPGVGCPVRVICGGTSRHMDAAAPGGSTPELYRQMAEQFPCAEGGVLFQLMDGVGHFGPLEAPARFASYLSPMLQTTTPHTTGPEPRSRL